MAWRKMRRKRGDQQQLGGDRERNRSGKTCEEVEKKSSLKLHKMVNETSRPERYGSSWEGHMAVRLSLFQLQSSSAGLFADKKRCGLK